MSNNIQEAIQGLAKALEAGNPNVAPSLRSQGNALQDIESDPDAMVAITLEEDALKLQKLLKVDPVKSTLVQFRRQLSPGRMGGSAQMEGAIGRRQDSEYTMAVVPMAYYSAIREVTVAAMKVAAFDGLSAEDRYAKDEALRIAADFEYDLFRGKADFSNAGVFDGNMAAIPALPSVLGLDAQVRMADGQRNARDLYFAAHGGTDSNIVSVGGVLSQDAIEDSHVRSVMQHGKADKLLSDPKCVSAYNKISFGKERIVLAGGPQDATAADLRRQWVSGGTVNIEVSRFLSGRTGPDETNSDAPSGVSLGAPTAAAASTSALLNEVYYYYMTACNELGESAPTAAQSVTITADGDKVTMTCVASAGSARFYRIYRTAAGGAATTAKFIGAVAANGTSAVTFTDLFNKLPGFVSSFLVQGDSMAIKELCPYSRMKLGVSQLAVPEAHFRFATLAVMKPRVNVVLDNCVGSY